MNVAYLAYCVDDVERISLNTPTFVIGVKKDGVDVDEFVAAHPGVLEMVQRFPDTHNLKYAPCNDGGHMMQPAIIRRIK